MRTEAASRGGKAKALPNRVGSWTTRPIETTEDLRLGLAEAFYQCTLGKISTARSALSQAAGVFARLSIPRGPGATPTPCDTVAGGAEGEGSISADWKQMGHVWLSMRTNPPVCALYSIQTFL